MDDRTGMLKMALPPAKDDKGNNDYLAGLFARAAINKTATVLRQTNCLYNFGGGNEGFMGFHAFESDGAHYLLDRVVGGAIIDLARLVDIVCERGVDPSLVSYIPFGITDTQKDLVLALPVPGGDVPIDNRRQNNAHDQSDFIKMNDDHVVLTSYYGAAKHFFNAQDSKPKIKKLHGSLGTAARALYGPCSVIDMTKTGQSLTVNGLFVPDERYILVQSEAVLAWFEPMLLNPRAAKHISDVTARLGLRQDARKDMGDLPLFSPAIA